MIFGMTPLTFVHVLLSLIAIFSGFIAVFGMIAGKRLDGWTALFLVTTALTSITGFFFPFHKLLPSHILGIISLVVLALAIPARPRTHTIRTALLDHPSCGDGSFHRADHRRCGQVPP